MCFVDLTQVCDRVKLVAITAFLKNRGVQSNIIAIIRELNNDNHTHVRTTEKKRTRIISVTLELDKDEIIEKVKLERICYRIGNKEIKIVCNAGNAVKISKNEDNLRKFLYKIELAAKDTTCNFLFPKHNFLQYLKNRVDLN